MLMFVIKKILAWDQEGILTFMLYSKCVARIPGAGFTHTGTTITGVVVEFETIGGSNSITTFVGNETIFNSQGVLGKCIRVYSRDAMIA